MSMLGENRRRTERGGEGVEKEKKLFFVLLACLLDSLRFTIKHIFFCWLDLKKCLKNEFIDSFMHQLGLKNVHERRSDTRCIINKGRNK